MSKNASLIVAALAAVTGLGASVASAQVAIDFTTVGNPGNAGDPNAFDRGGVAYEYRIGRFEVTNEQYAAFLNIVAASDPNGLFNPNMGSNPRGGITRSGTDGSFTYAVRPNMGNKPVNFVSFFDAARMANWLTNGQGSGGTESGVYTLTGDSLVAITRDLSNPNQVFLPSQNEFIKAGYHQPAGQGGDTDNFRYPRFALDFSLCRVYDGGKPLDTSANHFTFSSGTLAEDAVVGPFCIVGPEVELGPQVELRSHVHVAGRTSLGARTRVFPFAVLGEEPQDKAFAGESTALAIGVDNVIREHSSIHVGTPRGGGCTRIGDDNFIMNGAHIGHDVQVGSHTIIASHVALAGHAVVEDYARIGGLSGVHFLETRRDPSGGVSGAEIEVVEVGHRDHFRLALHRAGGELGHRHRAERRGVRDFRRLKIAVEPAVLRALHAGCRRLHVVLGVEVAAGRIR